MNFSLVITVGSPATSPQDMFTLDVDDTLTIEAEPGSSSGPVQIEKLDFFRISEEDPFVSFALAEGQTPPPGIAWHWLKLKNGGVEAAEYSLRISGSMAEEPHAWEFTATLEILDGTVPASTSAAKLTGRENLEQDFTEHSLQVTVLSTDGRALTSHSATLIDLAFNSSADAGDVLNVSLAPAGGLGLSHPGLTRFYFKDSLTGHTVSDYSLAAMARMPPGITMAAIAFRNNGSDSAAHYQVYFFGTVRSSNAGTPGILGWLSDPELVVRTTGLLGGG